MHVNTKTAAWGTGPAADTHGIVGRSRGRPKPGPSLGITTHGITRDGLAYLRIGCRSIASVPPEFDGSVPGSFGSPAGGGGEDGIGASNAGEDKAGDSRAGDDSAGETSAGPAPSPPLSLRPGSADSKLSLRASRNSACRFCSTTLRIMA